MQEAGSQQPTGGSTPIIWMLLSAALFGYFGFMLLWPNTVSSQPNWISIVLMWTIRGAAIGFALCAVLTVVHRFLANVLFSAIGLVSAVLFGVVIVWDLTTAANAPISVLLLIVFALWNGYGSIAELREMLSQRRSAAWPSDR